MSKPELCLILKKHTTKRGSRKIDSFNKTHTKKKFTINLHKKEKKRKKKSKLDNTTNNTNNLNDGLTFKKRKHNLDSKSINVQNLQNSTDVPVIKEKKIRRAIKLKIATAEKPKCLARIATGSQCHRSRLSDDTVFCNCHHQHCPYGRIDGPLEGKKFLSAPKKRGPKKSIIKEYKLDELDQNMYLSTQLVKIDAKLFLIDKFGLLFTNDTNSEIIGRKIDNEIHWFFQ